MQISHNFNFAKTKMRISKTMTAFRSVLHQWNEGYTRHLHVQICKLDKSKRALHTRMANMHEIGYSAVPCELEIHWCRRLIRHSSCWLIFIDQLGENGIFDIFYKHFIHSNNIVHASVCTNSLTNLTTHNDLKQWSLISILASRIFK